MDTLILKHAITPDADPLMLAYDEESRRWKWLCDEPAQQDPLSFATLSDALAVAAKYRYLHVVTDLLPPEYRMELAPDGLDFLVVAPVAFQAEVSDRLNGQEHFATVDYAVEVAWEHLKGLPESALAERQDLVALRHLVLFNRAISVRIPHNRKTFVIRPRPNDFSLLVLDVLVKGRVQRKYSGMIFSRSRVVEWLQHLEYLGLAPVES